MTYNLHDLTILCIDSDPKTMERNYTFLKNKGLRVLSSDNAISAFDLFRTHKVDIIMIDIESPSGSGCELIRHLRQKNILTPVIITTHESTKSILLEVINLDITRFLLIPYTNEQLEEALHHAAQKVLFCHPLAYTDLHEGFHYDPVNKSIIHKDGDTHSLSKKEYLLLELLLHSHDRIVTYDEIENFVWNDQLMSMDALRTQIRNIRKKSYPELIENHNGIGYRINTNSI